MLTGPVRLQPCNRELVLRGQAGEVAALGALLERHEPRLLSTALAMLRDHAAAQDAVQETFVIALRRIGDVREPDEAGAWLHAVVRNVCRMTWRSAPSQLMEPLDDVTERLVSMAAGPEEHLDQLALRDWVWTALDRLPETSRAAATLRFFGSRTSYDEIALLLGIPVGTVRSRLNHARGQLVEALAATAEDVHTEARQLTLREHATFTEALAQMNAGVGFEHFAGQFAPDVRMEFADADSRSGRAVLDRVLDDDVASGLRMRATRVLATRGLTVLEMAFENPADNPYRCPPSTCQVHFRPDGQTTRVRIFFAPRPQPDHAQ